MSKDRRVNIGSLVDKILLRNVETPCNEAKFIVAILGQAIRDSLRKSPHETAMVETDWFFEGNYFKKLCGLIGLDPAFVLNVQKVAYDFRHYPTEDQIEFLKQLKLEAR